ncbi:MAG: STAS/SEC14 domain-containing protein [Flavobacteriales bacterium]
MTTLHLAIETSLAFITRTGPVMIETRFKPGVRITPAGMIENIRVRREMCRNVPHVMLTVIEGEHDIDPDLMRTDLFHMPEDRAVIKAVALVIDGNFLQQVASIYFSYFPQTFRTQVFGEEEAARRWLHEEALVIARTI